MRYIKKVFENNNIISIEDESLAIKELVEENFMISSEKFKLESDRFGINHTILINRIKSVDDTLNMIEYDKLMQYKVALLSEVKRFIDRMQYDGYEVEFSINGDNIRIYLINNSHFLNKENELLSCFFKKEGHLFVDLHKFAVEIINKFSLRQADVYPIKITISPSIAFHNSLDDDKIKEILDYLQSELAKMNVKIVKSKTALRTIYSLLPRDNKTSNIIRI